MCTGAHVPGNGSVHWTPRWTRPKRMLFSKKVTTGWWRRPFPRQLRNEVCQRLILVRCLQQSFVFNNVPVLLRSGGPSLKSSAAYTPAFAQWVLHQHMVWMGWEWCWRWCEEIMNWIHDHKLVGHPTNKQQSLFLISIKLCSLFCWISQNYIL